MVASSSRSETPGIPTGERVGFIGLGDMGAAIVTRIIAAAWPTVLWARRPEALEAFRAPNVEVAATPAALASGVDLVGICVWDDDDVREVLTGEHGVFAGCRPGTIVAIHSTVRPTTCRALAEDGASHGVFVVDAPVSGGPKVALAGFLTVAVGGDEAAVARCGPVFESFATTVVRVGDVGCGQIAKLLNNALLAANLAVADDALTLGAALGVDLDEFAAFLREGSGRSYALDVAQMLRGSREARDAALPALEKDVRGLVAEAVLDNGRGVLLRDAATETIRRLGDPPPGWVT